MLLDLVSVEVVFNFSSFDAFFALQCDSVRCSVRGACSRTMSNNEQIVGCGGVSLSDVSVMSVSQMSRSNSEDPGGR